MAGVEEAKEEAKDEAKEEVIGEKAKVKKSAIEKAIRALMQIVAKQTANSNQLFESNSEGMRIVFSLSYVPEKRRQRPYLIALPHPMLDATSEICFISKTPQREYKQLLLKKFPIPGLTKVIGIEKLRKYYVTEKDKRTLADTFDAFLCDRDVLEMMPKILGNQFYFKRHKPPLPVRIKKSDPVPLIMRVLNSAPLRVPTGPTTTVRIGRCSQSAEALCENAIAVIPTVLKFFADMENPVQSINITATNSPALPIWRRPAPLGPLGEPIELKAYLRKAASSAASDTGASRESDSEATVKGSSISESGETLSTKDTISEPDTTGDLLSEIDTTGETPSELASDLGSEAGEESDFLPAAQSLPAQGSKKRKKKRGGDSAAVSEASAEEAPAAVEAPAASKEAMGPPLKKKKKAAA